MMRLDDNILANKDEVDKDVTQSQIIVNLVTSAL